MNEDLIKRSDAIKAVKSSIEDGWGRISPVDACLNIRCLPSADRPQGEWIGGEIPTRCPICGHDWDEYVEGQEVFYTGDIPKYCPNCGARMKGADDADE